MIGYITLGTNNLEKAAAFYDALFGTVGIGRLMENDRLVAWGTDMGSPVFTVCTPYDGDKATPGNGTMIAVPAPDNATVDKLHAKALELGAKDEGTPGTREQAPPGFYLSYFRDLDGNKLALFSFTPPK